MKMFSFLKVFMFSVFIVSANFALAQNTPEAVIKETSDKMLASLKSSKSILKNNPAKIYDLVEKTLVPRFDFDTISQYTMGRSWKTATPAQRTRFVSEFKRLLIHSYATVFLEYTDETIRILPNRASNKEDVMVYSEIVSSNRAPVAVNYSMVKSGSNWMVYDVIVEGVSIVTNYRSEVRELANSKGIDGMIDAIAAKNRNNK